MSLLSANHPPEIPFIELQSVDSTNKYAMELIHEDRLPDLPDRQAGGQGRAEHGLAVFAYEQTAGKGQRGKSWSTGKGMNIALSLIINPFPLKPSEVFQLSACAAVAVHDFFCKYAGDETKIKWPNDIYWRDRKAGGVLIENVIRGQESGMGNWEWSVIGIGINVNQISFPVELPNPVSLKQITGKNFEPVILARELCVILNKHFFELANGEFKYIFDNYQQILYKKNEKVRLKKNNRIFETTIKGVAESGELIVQHAIEERFEFGTVEWIL